MRNLSFTLLILFCFGVVCLKAALSFQHPLYSPETPAGYYPTEAALQYRWAEMVSDGDSIPLVINDVQYPEGLRRGVDVTISMEYVAGYLYRILGEPLAPFHRFSIWFIAFITTTTLPVIFAFSLLLFRSHMAAWISVLFYGLHPFTYLRVVRNFGRENFALTFIFLSMLGLVLLVRLANGGLRTKRFYAVVFLAVFSQAIAFLSWHLSRFVFDVTMGGLLLLWISGRMNREQMRAVVIWFVCLIPLFLLLPVLRSRWYLLSPGALIGFFVVLDYLLYRRVSNSLVRRGILVFVLSGLFLLRPETDSHVFSVVFDKFRFLFSKPEDPQLLSPDSRIMWIEAFESPRIDQLLYYFVPFLFPGLPAAYLSLRGKPAWREIKAEVLLALILMTLFGAAFLLFFRLQVFFFFLFCIFLGGLVARSVGRRKGDALLYGGSVVCLFLLSCGVFTFHSGNPIRTALRSAVDAPESLFRNYIQNNRDLYDWIAENTGAEEPFAGWIGTTPAIYAYAHRPIVTHSKFENKEARDRFYAFDEALFSDEQDLVEFCEETGTEYVVFQANFILDDSTSSARYFAGYQDVRVDSVAMKMQFFPLELFDFELVYQNPSYRVFQFLEPDDKYRNLPIGYEPVFDKDVFSLGEGSAWNDEEAHEVYRKIDAMYQGYAAAVEALEAGDIETGKAILLRIVNENPKFYRAWLVLGEIEASEGNLGQAQLCWRNALIGYPDHPLAKRRLQAAEETPSPDNESLKGDSENP